MNKRESSLITIGEVAKRANVSKGTVRRWILLGMLPAYQFPGSGKDPIWRVMAEDFEAFWSHYRFKPVIPDSQLRAL